MKVQNPKGETIPDVGVRGPIMCESCKCAHQVTGEWRGNLFYPTSDKCKDCQTCDDILAPTGTAEKPPMAMEPNAPSVSVPPRPSLEVETEVNRRLKPRILAHVARMKAWDLRKLSIEDRATVSCSLDALASCFARVEDALAMLAKAGFVAKTTPVTRIAAKLEFRTKVTLRADQRETFAQIYTDEQLDSLSVTKTTDTHVQLMAADGSNIGLVKLIHVEIKPWL
jgi:hypothetical protein